MSIPLPQTLDEYRIDREARHLLTAGLPQHLGNGTCSWRPDRPAGLHRCSAAPPTAAQLAADLQRYREIEETDLRLSGLDLGAPDQNPADRYDGSDPNWGHKLSPQEKALLDVKNAQDYKPSDPPKIDELKRTHTRGGGRTKRRRTSRRRRTSKRRRSSKRGRTSRRS